MYIYTGSLDGNPLNSHIMYDCLRQSKSILCFTPQRPIYDDGLRKVLLESGILKLFLDNPEQYRILIVGVMEKEAASEAGREFAIGACEPEDGGDDQPGSLPEKSDLYNQLAVDGVQTFVDTTRRDIRSKKLWMSEFEDRLGDGIDDNLLKHISAQHIRDYEEHLRKAQDRIMFSPICPITYASLSKLTSKQAQIILTDNENKVFEKKMTIRGLMECTRIPTLIKELRSILIDESFHVSCEFAERMDTYKNQLQNLVALCEKGKELLSHLKGVMSKYTDEKRTRTQRSKAEDGFGMVMDKLHGNISAVFKSFKSEQIENMIRPEQKACRENNLKAIGSGPVDVTHFVTLDPKDKSVIPLLQLLFQDLVDPYRFKTVWWQHCDQLDRELNEWSQESLRPFLLQSYSKIRSEGGEPTAGAVSGGSDDYVLYENFIESNVNQIISEIKSKIGRKLTTYRSIFSPQRKGGLWGMRPTVQNVAYTLFENLSREEKNGRANILSAIAKGMHATAQKGADQVFTAPKYLTNPIDVIDALKFTSIEKEGSECSKLRKWFGKKFEKSILQLVSWVSNEKTEANLQDELSKIRDLILKLEKASDHVSGQCTHQNFSQNHWKPCLRFIHGSSIMESDFDEHILIGKCETIEIGTTKGLPKVLSKIVSNDSGKAIEYTPPAGSDQNLSFYQCLSFAM